MQFLIAVRVLTQSFLSAVAPIGVSSLGDGASSSKRKRKIVTPVAIQYGHPHVGIHHSPRLKHPHQCCDLSPVTIDPQLVKLYRSCNVSTIQIDNDTKT